MSDSRPIPTPELPAMCGAAVRLHRVVRRLVARLHVHRWEETLWNAWGIDVEQRCRCGQYRHHLFVNRRGFCEEPDWQPDKHPNRHMAKPPNDQSSATPGQEA
jgi:hypothetical protein